MIESDVHLLRQGLFVDLLCFVETIHAGERYSQNAIRISYIGIEAYGFACFVNSFLELPNRLVSSAEIVVPWVIARVCSR